MPSQAARFRALLAAPDMIVAPGAYDAITARLIEQAGYTAVYMTGAGTSAARGYPDYGLLTLSEMVENAAAIARSVAVPLIADADTGYGNELNVTRTVRDFEGRGVAAIHLEDQVSPKRCGHLDGKQIVPRDEFLSKIRAAVAARRDPDFTIIARTDARAVAGLDEALERANAALAAGADMVFVEAVESLEEMAAVPQRVHGPCLLNIVPGGKTPIPKLAEAQALGYRLAILPGLLLREVILAADAGLRRLRETGEPPVPPPGVTVMSTFRRFGADEWDRLRRSYAEGSGA
ncbi:MAG: isocitrate lyase/PEP mutase family protein [Aliidongia sp.]